MVDGSELKFLVHFFNTNDQFHKIIFALDDHKMTVAENCRQLFQRVDNELEFGQFQANQFNIHLGPIKGRHKHGLQIREFSVFQHQIEQICPQMEMLIDNRFQTEYLPNEIGHRQKSSINPNELDRNEVAVENNEGEKEMAKRMDFLEDQITHWSQIFNKFEGRMKRIELHQRGCIDLSGKQMWPGQRIQNHSMCTECQCGLDSELHCKPIGCPHLRECAHPVYEKGKCCPRCGKKCFHNGKYYESGEESWPKQCTYCRCNDGRMECGFRFSNTCPLLDCPQHQQETLPNQCCPVCVNLDHCAPRRNPCSPNANCHTTRHSAICRCKEGFFGNGTICADIDECLWDSDARKQLDGCGDGTVCINLPGSFKCECLPGYQKLDDRNCLDVIRI